MSVEDIAEARIELELFMLSQGLYIHTTNRNQFVCEISKLAQVRTVYFPFRYKGIKVHSLIR